MNWIVIAIIVVVVIAVFFAIFGALPYMKKKEKEDIRGTAMFKDIDTPLVFKANQRYWRFAYATFKILHFLLLTLSTTFSSITIYMVIDDTINSNIRITCSVLALIFSTLHAIINPDKVANAFGSAMRRLENAIIEYGYVQHQDCDSNKGYKILSEANSEAQQIIEDRYG